jgi:hypothetical protein
MGKVGKIAIGCVLFLFLAGVALIAGLGGLAWWGKGKIEQLTKGEQKISEAKARADAISFAQPADGVIAEDRLLKFLEVRKRVFVVYDKHKAEFDALKDKRQGELSDLTKFYGIITEVRQSQAEALGDLGMSSDEYRYMVGAIYASQWASEVSRATGGKSVSEVADQALGQAAEAMKAAGGAPEAQQAMDALRAHAGDLKAPDVPLANIELFRKHEAEIKQYAMGGLELLGL